MLGNAKPGTNDEPLSVNPEGSRQETMRAAQPDSSKSQIDGHRGDRITPDRVISFLASLGALVTALVAMLSLSEIKKQREVAWRPDVVPDSPVHLSLKVDVASDFEIEVKSQGKYSNVAHGFPIRVHNFGYGPAKKVQFRWIYNAKEFIDWLDRLDQQDEFESDADDVILRMTLGARSISTFVSMPSELIFLPEYDSGTQEYFFTLQPDFLSLLGAYAYLSKKNSGKTSSGDAFFYMRGGTLQVDYYDVGNTHYQQFYKMRPSFMMLEEVGNSVEMKINFGFESTDAAR